MNCVILGKTLHIPGTVRTYHTYITFRLYVNASAVGSSRKNNYTLHNHEACTFTACNITLYVYIIQ